MKRNPQFIMSKISDLNVLVPIGTAAADFNGVISLNGMGSDIWSMLEEDISRDELLAKILSEYDVSEEKASADIDSFLNTLREAGCLEE